MVSISLVHDLSLTEVLLELGLLLILAGHLIQCLLRARDTCFFQLFVLRVLIEELALFVNVKVGLALEDERVLGCFQVFKIWIVEDGVGLLTRLHCVLRWRLLLAPNLFVSVGINTKVAFIVPERSILQMLSNGD